MPPPEAPPSPAPAVNDSVERAIEVVPATPENVTTENVPGIGVDNPPRTDFVAETRAFIAQNVFNDLAFFDSSLERSGAPQPGAEQPAGAERRKEIDAVKARFSDSTINSIPENGRDKFFGSAIDTARDLTSAKPEDVQKKYDTALQTVPPEQREVFNKAVGIALHEQGSHLRTGNAPPVGLLIDKSDQKNEKIVGRAAIADFPEHFQADQRAIAAAPTVKEAADKVLSDVPPNQQTNVGFQIGDVIAAQEKQGLLAPIKDIGARERQADLASPETQAAKLKTQLGPVEGKEPVVDAAVDAANKIAFAKPEDMHKLFNEGMQSLAATGIDKTAAARILGQALKNVSKDFNVHTANGNVEQTFLADKRLATPANPDGTIGVADRGTAPGDPAANHAAFLKGTEVAAAIRATNTQQLGRTPSAAQVEDHVDRVFKVLRYF
ncbi:MAG: hypothetical protein C0507_21350 [Cyanobacteria bacterium PR.3.49]|nr:hypothetical protein [Cyanobacteria bacterium PR.3.49]